MTRPLVVLGLMSGTSLDGVDAALLVTDGERIERTGPFLTMPYHEEFRARLKGILGGTGPVATVERELTLLHAEAVRSLLGRAGLESGAMDAVGFHGHTILHRPDEGKTWQIGDGALLAEMLGIRVINDFRSADVAAGGQGAPLVPVYHRALAASLEGPLAVLNLGGVGNVTWIGEARDATSLIAFDTGPGNALIDDWAFLHTGKPMDEGGRLASAGVVDSAALKAFLAHPYFLKKPPKSLDRDDFRDLSTALTQDLAPADGAATLTAFTIAAVARAMDHFPRPPKRWLVCGGGRRNPRLMAGLTEALLPAPVETVETVGWNGDALEAEAFAFLAARHIRGLPITYPSTTGARVAVVGGRSHAPARSP